MKYFVVALMAGFTLLTALNVFAFSGSNDEAVMFIQKAMADEPEIQAWVENKFGSQDIFMKAVRIAPDETVQQIAQTFQDFKQHGGDLETAAEVAIWVYLAVLIASLAMFAILI